MAGKKDVSLNFFEQLMQIAMSQEIYLHKQTDRRTKLILKEPDAAYKRQKLFHFIISKVLQDPPS